MAKRGRPPKATTVDGLPESLRTAIDQFIDSHRRNSCKSIFNRFGLVDRGLNFETFRKYVRRRRRGTHSYKTEEAPMALDAYERGMELAIKRIDTGDPKHLAGIASFLRVCIEHRRLGFDEAAERRAAERHDAWKKEYLDRLAKEKAAADAKLDRMADAEGIKGDVKQAIKDLYGLKS